MNPFAFFSIGAAACLSEALAELARFGWLLAGGTCAVASTLLACSRVRWPSQPGSLGSVAANAATEVYVSASVVLFAVIVNLTIA